ncbi:hypothetical protein Sjap_024012 [Stephania japonica]|uniref:Uncharacterized protein n=1 Tax=Stephania japonica TaxID=461633 RepID=A0AAP0ECP2_9MAGN
MARTNRTEDVRKAEKSRKTEEVNKKTAKTGKVVGRRAQIASYRKSKELGRGKGDSELYDEASRAQALKGWELAIHRSQVSSAEVSSPKSSEEDQEEVQDQSSEEKSEDGSEAESGEKSEEAHEERSESEDKTGEDEE